MLAADRGGPTPSLTQESRRFVRRCCLDAAHSTGCEFEWFFAPGPNQSILASMAQPGPLAHGMGWGRYAPAPGKSITTLWDVASNTKDQDPDPAY